MLLSEHQDTPTYLAMPVPRFRNHVQPTLCQHVQEVRRCGNTCAMSHRHVTLPPRNCATSANLSHPPTKETQTVLEHKPRDRAEDVVLEFCALSRVRRSRVCETLHAVLPQQTPVSYLANAQTTQRNSPQRHRGRRGRRARNGIRLMLCALSNVKS